MPTIIQESVYQTAMNVYADVEERVESIARDALTEMIAARIEERDAFLPLFAEINSAWAATKETTPKGVIPLSELATALQLRGSAEKRPFKVHQRRIAELRDTLALHDDDSMTLYTLFCTDGQGKDKDGNELPARVATYPDYLAWLVDRAAVEKELNAKAYTKGGKRTQAHDALIAKRKADADAKARFQLTGTDYSATYPRTQRGVEDIHRDIHDMQRALLLMREEMLADAKLKTAWTKGRKAFNDALPSA